MKNGPVGLKQILAKTKLERTRFMPDFSFEDSKRFEENCTEFLVEIEAIDTEMATILKENWPSLVKIVEHGERDPKARTEFNAAIAQALDALLQAPQQGD